MRAFVAIEMPEPVRRGILSVQRRLTEQLRTQQLDRCVRWTPASNLHLTLRFLGEIDVNQRDLLVAALAQIARAHAPLSLYSDGLGCFPNARRPNVIWCGVKGELADLGRLQVAVERAAIAVGLPPEEKPFKPHLTVGRLQRSASSSQLQAAGAAVAQLGGVLPPAAPTTERVSELLLMQSELTPSGSLYTQLGVFPLARMTDPAG